MTDRGHCAVVLTGGLFQGLHAKTAHGLLRGPSRYRIVGVVDPASAGRDAGELLDGKHRDVPVFESLRAALRSPGERPDVCIVGVTTGGGTLPPQLRADLLFAAAAGMTLVSGLHQLLSDDEELVRRVERSGGRIIDIRKPRPVSQLRFWSGEVLALETPRVAVLGTDCVIGKRTTCLLLLEALRRRGTKAEMIYTGQTGWLQGLPFGFILDATPNDFVSGELERAVLECARHAHPEVILLEGQSGLRNPSGPCGSELLLSAGARGVVLQHAPARTHFIEHKGMGCKLPSLPDEIALVHAYGSEVWAVALNQEGLSPERAVELRDAYACELGLPVALPLCGDLEPLVEAVRARIFSAGDG